MAPAGELVLNIGETEQFQQLTDAVLKNLTELELSDISLFQFPEEDVEKGPLFPGCKTFPGDLRWPSERIWKVFSLLAGGALIETVPIGAVCYEDNRNYDAVKCEDILNHWTESETQ